MRTLSWRHRLLAMLAAAWVGFGAVGAASQDDATVEVALVPLAYATFAGGCFWCMEPPFDKLDGVVSTTAGYAGGPERNPTYKQVSAGATGHAEVVQVAFDPAKVSYEKLLEVYWRNIDPFAIDRQFCDGGRQYRSAIYTHDEAQRQAAEASKQAIAARFAGQKIATEIAPLAGSFFAAEDYHQDYYLKNPIRYRYYRNGCGRDRRLEAIWGKSE